MRVIVLKLTLLFLMVVSCSGQSPVSKSTSGALVSVNLSDELRIKEVQKDVFIVAHSYPWPANALLVRVSDDEFVFVDTPYTDEATNAVLDWVRSAFGEVNITEINTGFHVDNLGGNGALIAAGVPVHGSSLSAKLLLDRGEATRTKLLEWLTGPENAVYFEAHKTMTYTPPNQVFDITENKSVTLIHPSVEVFYPGPSHSADNLVVYFKKQRVLFGGCMIKSTDAQNLGFTGDADLQAWPVSTRRVLEKYPDAEIVVPGHGEPSDGTLPLHTLSLFQDTGTDRH